MNKYESVVIINPAVDEEGMKALETAYMKLDKACAKGIVHKNYVANQKSRLAKVVNGIA